MTLVWSLAACIRPQATSDALRPISLGSVPIEELARVQLVATGDAMMHGLVQRSAADADILGEDGRSTNHEGYDVVFGGIAPLVRAADIGFVNLEFPVAPKVGQPNREMVFNAPPVVLDAIVSAGFDVASAANNHSYDQGRKGLVETIENLEATDLIYLGAGLTCETAEAVRSFERGGVKIAFLGTTALFNDPLNGSRDQPCVAEFDEDKILSLAASAREEGAEFVVLSVHWGVEYEITPTDKQVQSAHRLIEGGVDLVLGHHPHVLQPIDVIEAENGRVGVVAYSLGNLVSSQSAFYSPGLADPAQGYTRDGLLLSIDLVRRAYGRGDQKIERQELSRLRAIPLWTTHRRRGGVVEIHVDPVEDRLRTLHSQLDEAEEEDEIVRISREILEMEQRIRLTSRIVGPMWVGGR